MNNQAMFGETAAGCQRECRWDWKRQAVAVVITLCVHLRCHQPPSVSVPAHLPFVIQRRFMISGWNSICAFINDNTSPLSIHGFTALPGFGPWARRGSQRAAKPSEIMINVSQSPYWP